MSAGKYASRLAIAFLALVLISVSAEAQIRFQRTYGGPLDDKATAVRQLSDGGYIVGGQTLSYGAGHYDLWLLRTDANGDTLWTRTYGGDQGEYGTAVEVTPDGFLLLSHTASFGAESTDVWLVKTSATGDTQWTRRFGGPCREEYGSVARLASGEIVFCGTTSSSGAGGMDMWMVKTDASGNQLWAKTYGGAQDDYALGLTPTSDNGFLLCGYTQSFGAGHFDCWVLKLDAAGDTQWARTYGGPGPDLAGCGFEKPGGYVIGGNTASYGAGGWDLWAIGINAAGDMQWNRTYGGQYSDWGFGGCATAGGSFVFSGFWSTSMQNSDVVLLNIGPGGDSVWIRTYGGSGVDQGAGCGLTSDQGFCIAASSNSYSAGDFDFYLIKTDANGIIGIQEPARRPTPRPALRCEPNPFRGKTAISLRPAADGPSEIGIYDAAGRPVRVLAVSAERSAASIWDGSDFRGRPAPRGVYVVRCGTDAARLVKY